MKLLPLLLLSVCIVQGGIILDNFDRPNGVGLGPNWTAQVGNAEILGNRARAQNAAGTSYLLTYNGVASDTASVDVYVAGTDLAYIALVLGYGGGSNYFIKVQNQSGDSFFHNYAFYRGNNSEGGPFSTLGSPFSSGRITASYSGTAASLAIDSNFDGVSEQFYSYNYSGSAPTGSGIGLGFWGSAQADNFGIPGGASIPEPSSLTLAAGGLTALLLAWRRLIH